MTTMINGHSKLNMDTKNSNPVTASFPFSEFRKVFEKPARRFYPSYLNRFPILYIVPFFTCFCNK